MFEFLFASLGPAVTGAVVVGGLAALLGAFSAPLLAPLLAHRDR